MLRKVALMSRCWVRVGIASRVVVMRLLVTALWTYVVRLEVVVSASFVVVIMVA